MTIQDWGALGDMIGGIAVVASLIYLAIQIRQNTQQIAHSIETSRLSAFERNIESANRVRELLIRDSDLARLFLRGSEEYDDLDSSEKFRFGLVMSNIMTAFQGAYLRHISVGGDPLQFQGTARLIDSILGNAGARVWLDQHEADWRPEFREFIEVRLANLDRQTEDPGDDESPAETGPG